MADQLFTVSVAQVAPTRDAAAAIKKVDEYAARAAGERSRLVLFPEAYIGGYPRGESFGAVVGARSDEGRDAFHRYWKAAIDVPGTECARLGEIAAAHQIYLIIGVIERAGGTLYCTVLFFSPAGKLMGKHRKLMPTGSERLIWGFGDGSTMPVFTTPIGKVGAVVCWENYMPLLRAAHYAKGIEIYCAPTADSRDTWLPTLRHIAIEGRCFVLSANQFARRGDTADGGSTPDEIVCRGGSCIIDPFGRVMAGPDFEGETLLSVPIDLAEIARGKFDFDAVGHYARPDVFNLRVNEADARPVTFVGHGHGMPSSINDVFDSAAE